MTLGRLKELQQELNIPDEAMICVYADHGQDCELSYSLTVSRSMDTNCPDSMIWEYSNYKDVYDDDALEEYDVNGKITAICINGD